MPGVVIGLFRVELSLVMWCEARLKQSTLGSASAQYPMTDKNALILWLW